MCIISFLTSFMIVFILIIVTLPSRTSNTLTQPRWGHKSAHLLQFHEGEIWGGNLNHIIVTLLWGKVNTIFGSKWNWWTGCTWFETKEGFFCLDGPYPCFAFSFCSHTTKQLCNSGKKVVNCLSHERLQCQLAIFKTLQKKAALEGMNKLSFDTAIRLH